MSLFGMHVLAYPQIDPILDFPISHELFNGVLKVSTLGSQIGENRSFSPLKFLGGTHEHPNRT